MDKWYFISVPDRMQEIQSADDDFGFELFSLDEVEGIIVPFCHFGRLLDLLGLAMRNEKESSFSGIWQVEICKASEIVYDVTTQRWDISDDGQFANIAREILLPLMKKDIVLSGNCNERIPTRNDGRFHIMLYSGVRNSGRRHSPSKIWGFPIRSEISYKSTKSGFVVSDGEYDVAELFPNNLYIHHKLRGNANEGEVAIFRRVLEEIAKEILLTPEERRVRQLEIMKTSRAPYADLCAQRFVRQQKQAEKDVEKGISAQNSSVSRAALLHREKTVSELKLSQMTPYLDADRATLTAEFPRIAEVEGVTALEVTKECLQVFTEPLVCSDANGKQCGLGPFRIDFQIVGQGAKVKAINLERKKKKLPTHAPHVSKEGYLLLDVSQALHLATLVATYKFADATTFIIEFLQHIDTGHVSHGNMVYFPVVKEQAA